MLRKKGFVRPSYIVHRSKNQLGNTLIPVIIALAISAVASIAFLKQGASLVDQKKELEAQYELAYALQQWNRVKGTKNNINMITSGDLPATAKAGIYTLAYNPGNARTSTPASASVPAPTSSGSLTGGSLFSTTPITSNDAHFTYGPFQNEPSCSMLKNTFNQNMVGIFESRCQITSVSGTYYLYIYVN